MENLQDKIYSDAYADLLIPYRYLSPERAEELLTSYDYQILNSEYAVLHVPYGTVYNPGSSFRFSLVPNLFLPLDTVPLETTGILRVQDQPYLGLKGRGVLVGVIDTGITYTHPTFRRADGSTRIWRIWDQTIPDESGNAPFSYGTVYTGEQIDAALQTDDPLLLVPSADADGHGTYVAGVAAGSEDLSADFCGAAPEATLAVVRLKEAKPHLKNFYYYSGSDPVFQETDIIAAVEYLRLTAQEAGMPLVVCLALGSSQGDHSGFTPLDLSLRTLDNLPRVTTVCAAGNEGGRAHHFHGTAPGAQEETIVEIPVKEGTGGFFLELWAAPPGLISVGLRSPAGALIPRIPVSLERTETVRFYLEETRVYLYYELLQNTSGNELVMLRFERPTPGLWQLIVYNSSPYAQPFDIWLPVSGFLSPDVTFLTPNVYTTVTTPGNAPYVTTVTAYDTATSGLFVHAGRGYAANGLVKPDLAAPGVGVSGPARIAGYRIGTGSSAAAALCTGGLALFMEWGIRQDPPQYYSTYQLKNLLIRGALRDPTLAYPNRDWGFGVLDLYHSLTSVSLT